MNDELSLRSALAILGLVHGADRAMVTDAYRRLARLTHPDRCDAPDAAARFAELTAAYRVARAHLDSPCSPVSGRKIPVTLRTPPAPRLQPDAAREMPIRVGPVRVWPQRPTQDNA